MHQPQLPPSSPPPYRESMGPAWAPPPYRTTLPFPTPPHPLSTPQPLVPPPGYNSTRDAAFRSPPATPPSSSWWAPRIPGSPTQRTGFCQPENPTSSSPAARSF
uniref:Uncharacterized protein n=1 Tax=Opuntia streptacantha TaxID=393608 RepID=A0A7C9EFT3_OPUST